MTWEHSNFRARGTSQRIKKKISNGNVNYYYLSGGQFGPTHVIKCHIWIAIDSVIAQRMTCFITLFFIPVKEI